VSARRCRDSPRCSFRREARRSPATLPGVTSTLPRAGNPAVKRAIIGVGRVALIALLGYQLYRAQQPPKGGDPHNDIPQLQATKYYDFVGGDHREDPIHYDQVPPAGGPHGPVWDDCGAYDDPIRNENGGHALGSGT